MNTIWHNEQKLTCLLKTKAPFLLAARKESKRLREKEKKQKELDTQLSILRTQYAKEVDVSKKKDIELKAQGIKEQMNLL